MNKKDTIIEVAKVVFSEFGVEKQHLTILVLDVK